MAELEVKNAEMADENRQALLENVITDIKNILEKSRAKVAAEVNKELLATYWKIGEIIVKYEQNEQIRAAYGEKTLIQFSRALPWSCGPLLRGQLRSGELRERFSYRFWSGAYRASHSQW